MNLTPTFKHLCTILAFILSAGATPLTQAEIVYEYYEETSQLSGDQSRYRSFETHANPTTLRSSSRTGDGGGTEGTVIFTSGPAPSVFGRAEAWSGGGQIPGSGFDANLSYGFTVIGPANSFVPIRFRGRYEIGNDSFVTQTYANIAISASGMDFSRPDAVGMDARCSGSFDGYHCYASPEGWISENSFLSADMRTLGFDSTYWSVAVEGFFNGVLMAPTDASGLARGDVNLGVSGGAAGFRDDGISGVSWAFIDPELSIDPDFLFNNPGAELRITPGVGNEMAAVLAVPEPGTYTIMLLGLGLMAALASRRKDKNA